MLVFPLISISFLVISNVAELAGGSLESGSSRELASRSKDSHFLRVIFFILFHLLRTWEFYSFIHSLNILHNFMIFNGEYFTDLVLRHSLSRQSPWQSIERLSYLVPPMSTLGRIGNAFHGKLHHDFLQQLQVIVQIFGGQWIYNKNYILRELFLILTRDIEKSCWNTTIFIVLHWNILSIVHHDNSWLHRNKMSLGMIK